MSPLATWPQRFGQTIRARRESRRWSQETLALAAGLNRSYLGEVERGEGVPSLATMAKLAEALGEPLSALLARCEAAAAAALAAAPEVEAQRRVA